MPTKWLQERQDGSKNDVEMPPRRASRGPTTRGTTHFFFFFFTLVTGPRGSLSLKLSDTLPLKLIIGFVPRKHAKSQELVTLLADIRGNGTFVVHRVVPETRNPKATSPNPKSVTRQQHPQTSKPNPQTSNTNHQTPNTNPQTPNSGFASGLGRWYRECFYSLACSRARSMGAPREALRGGISTSFLEPSYRSWGHFVGIYRQN